jgi:uncharacterized protein
MDISGSQKINAPQQAVFNALLNPAVLQESIPGCEAANLVEIEGRQQLKLKISPNFPGFKGPYVVYVWTGEVVPHSRVTLLTEPSNALGSIKAQCIVDLVEEASGVTNLTYTAHADREGKIAATPEMIIKPAVKTALDQFFKNFEKQASIVRA